MLNFATNVPNPFDIPRLVKLDLYDVQPRRRDAVLVLEIVLYGPSGIPWPEQQRLLIRDVGNSTVLRVNPSATKQKDWITTPQVALAGTPYPTLLSAWHGNSNSGDFAGRIKKVENLLVSTGAVDPLFAPAPT